MQGALPPHPTLLVFTNIKQACTFMADKLPCLHWRAWGRARRFERPISRMRNAGQSEAASRSASILKHEVGVCGHGGHAHRRYLGGPGGECRLLEVPFWECAMRGSPWPHPALLGSLCTKWAYAVMADMPTVGISEGPGVYVVYSRSHFANTQCEAVRGRIQLC